MSLPFMAFSPVRARLGAAALSLAGAALVLPALGASVAGEPLAPLANATTPGPLAASATLISAGFEWRIGGDANRNCAVTLEYRKLGESAWRPAQPLLRVESGLWTRGEDPGNLLAGSLFFLKPGTAYQARLTLLDPDGGADQRVVEFTTRTGPRTAATRTFHVVPGAGGGSGAPSDPFRGLAAADAVALPGDLFLLQPGTYTGMFTVTRDGTAERPIVYRGVAQASVILDGGGGLTSGSHSIRLVGRRHVVVENLSLVNCLRPVNADSSEGVVVRGCFVRPVEQLVGVQGIRAAMSRDLLIANNTVRMTGQWATIGRTGAYGTGGYGIRVEGTGHVICHNAIVEGWDGVTIPVTDGGVPATITRNVDIYENFVDRASDDGVEADATHHNIRVFHNRLLNTGSAVSFQPLFGGPGYVLFNEMYNNRIEPYKFHQETSYGWTQETSGFLVYHNTSVCNRNGWYETGIWRNGRFRNNLVLGGRVSAPTFQANYTYPGADFDHDGYNRVNGNPTLIRFSGVSYADLPAFFAGTGNERSGREVAVGDFVSASLPHHPEWNYTDGYGAPYGPADNDLRLAPGSRAIDAGVALANINDGFAGTAPDLGCHETGAPAPAYGPRPEGAPLAAAASADPPAGPAPLAVRFTGGSANARGLVTAYHWDFGDGREARDERSPVHVYADPGVYTAVLTVADDDGSLATAAVVVEVTGPPAHADSRTAGISLSPSSPNPFAVSTTVQFTIPAPAAVRLDVCDVRGARVRTLAEGEFPAGAHSRTWDGTAGDGARAGAGVYFLRLTTGGTRIVRRVALVP